MAAPVQLTKMIKAVDLGIGAVVEIAPGRVRESTRGRLVEVDGRVLAECLVRALVVELAAKTVEEDLLSAQGGGGLQRFAA